MVFAQQATLMLPASKTLVVLESWKASLSATLRRTHHNILATAPKSIKLIVT